MAEEGVEGRKSGVLTQRGKAMIARRKNEALRKAYNAMSTHCQEGHRRTPQNTTILKDGWRVCIPCRTAKSLAAKLAKRRCAMKPVSEQPERICAKCRDKHLWTRAENHLGTYWHWRKSKNGVTAIARRCMKKRRPR